MRINKSTLLRIIKEEVERSIAASRSDLSGAQASHDSTMEAGDLLDKIKAIALESGSIELLKKAKDLYNEKDIEGLKNILQDVS